MQLSLVDQGTIRHPNAFLSSELSSPYYLIRCTSVLAKNEWYTSGWVSESVSISGLSAKTVSRKLTFGVNLCQSQAIQGNPYQVRFAPVQWLGWVNYTLWEVKGVDELELIQDELQRLLTALENEP